MSDLFATYGPDVVAWVLAALGTLLSAHVWNLVREGYVRGILQRAWVEVCGAVLEVCQTFTDQIKLGRADGTLTAEERLQARTKAIEIARANLGSKGLARLARVIGIDVNQWLASKTEQAVKVLKTPAGDAPLPSMIGGVAIPPPPVPTPRRPA